MMIWLVGALSLLAGQVPDGGGVVPSVDAGAQGSDNWQVGTLPADAFPKDTVVTVIRSHQIKIKDCYESELSRHPLSEGKVTVRITIAASGAVTALAFAPYPHSTLSSQILETCMSNEIRTWKFPEPRGGGPVLLTYPWKLQIYR